MDPIITSLLETDLYKFSIEQAHFSYPSRNANGSSGLLFRKACMRKAARTEVFSYARIRRTSCLSARRTSIHSELSFSFSPSSPSIVPKTAAPGSSEKPGARKKGRRR